jgi:hypothetical protein
LVEKEIIRGLNPVPKKWQRNGPYALLDKIIDKVCSKSWLGDHFEPLVFSAHFLSCHHQFYRIFSGHELFVGAYPQKGLNKRDLFFLSNFFSQKRRKIIPKYGKGIF